MRFTAEIRQSAQNAKAWPFVEARKILKRLNGKDPEKGFVLFETGYGPSGLPHLGTFGEVARTEMVRQAFAALSDIPTRLICFSDDLDGLRKVPGNVPNQGALAEALDLPLTKVPDPFGVAKSFGHSNNAKLCEFLDAFEFDYEFVSSTEMYFSGKFDEALLNALGAYDKIMEIMLPTLGAERQKTYSPFLPISAKTGKVLQVPTLARDLKKGTIVYEEPDGERIEIPVTGGAVKLQWKPDWAMRWVALGVDYEMSGKDLIESTIAGASICRALGGQPPVGFSYEHFLDADGQKISKSKGNGLSIEEWLRYASADSLALFMYQKPQTAKRLHFGEIPKAMDEHQQHLTAWPEQSCDKQIQNPAWFIHRGEPPEPGMSLSFSMLLNLASASAAENKDTLWAFIHRYQPGASAETLPVLDEAVGFAVRYYQDFVRPGKTFRMPDEQERAALEALDAGLAGLPGHDAASIQSLVYEIGKAHEFEPMRRWFSALYETLLGQSQGPRFGSFAALYGVGETRQLIAAALARRAA